MNKDQFVKNLESDIEQVLEAETEDFFELVNIAELNPLTDFTEADLSEISLKGGKLKGANLSGTNLSSTDLSGADLRDANLSGADLSGADLRDANLSGANFSGAKVKNALFRNNQGVSEAMKFNLIRRGAEFGDSQSEVEDSNINIENYETLKSKREWLESNKGKYVALVDGELVYSHEKEEDLYEWLKNSEYRDKSVLVEKVEDRRILMEQSFFPLLN